MYSEYLLLEIYRFYQDIWYLARMYLYKDSFYEPGTKLYEAQMMVDCISLFYVQSCIFKSDLNYHTIASQLIYSTRRHPLIYIKAHN